MGDDERLQDWFLEYVFTQQERGGEWRFETYSGTYNLEVGLPVKAEFYETDYRAD